MSLESLPNEILIPILSRASEGLETDLQNQRARAGLFISWCPVETEALALLHFRTSVGVGQPSPLLSRHTNLLLRPIFDSAARLE